MVFGDIVFNPVVDLCEVDQFGYVDLRNALETHTVPGDLNPDDMSYNEIDDPSSIVGKPSDIFSAIQSGHQYASFIDGQSPDQGDSK